MRLVVCALADLDREVVRHRPAGVVTLLSPSQAAPSLPSDTPRLVLSFHDIAEPAAGLTAPTTAMVADLLTFADAFPDGAVLLLHCWMGISRSPAAAFILACAGAPAGAEAGIAAALRHAAPSATPNALLVSLADDRLGRGGRMRTAVAAIGRGAEASRGSPFVLNAHAWEARS